MTVIHHSHANDHSVPYAKRGPAPTNVLVGYGFWLYLLSDIIMFSAMFAAYAVLSSHTAGGPKGIDLFVKGDVLLETVFLLVSSFTCGIMGLASAAKNRNHTYWAALATFVLGAGFLILELQEFSHMVHEGAGPSRSAFLSAFFALVGLHGLHVFVGLVWLVVMMLQVKTIGFSDMVQRRLNCFNLFWHALDIVWIGVFTIVYLGAK
ncbi:MAG: cytochrome o ubiquinol oxidase subunit III [Methylophilaceae bacterium]|nr:cytochrome o ubiquinol oxidase subunit III [Methylophilaceae bacterium]MDG1446047.1 cytochrome o ubiquinol oxidase subunit III [Methylophilaceae bacterium]MDG2293844.1 cytochrome o ubiquinol oxidase subunit III [Methylophilaceae bacterium]